MLSEAYQRLVAIRGSLVWTLLRSLLRSAPLRSSVNKLLIYFYISAKFDAKFIDYFARLFILFYRLPICKTSTSKKISQQEKDVSQYLARKIQTKNILHSKLSHFFLSWNVRDPSG